MPSSRLVASLLTVSLAQGASLLRRETSTATVDASTDNGAPQQLAAGIIFGIPVPNNIPSDDITALGINHGRCDCYYGWEGVDLSKGRYQGCFDWCESTIKSLNGLTGARSDFMPMGFNGIAETYLNGKSCDNGDCTKWGEFLHQWLNDIKNAGLTDIVNIEPYNEPELFGISVEQFLQGWNYAYPIIREILPNTPIVGPSIANVDLAGWEFWNAWMKPAVTENTIPDKICSHLEGTGGGSGGDDPTHMIEVWEGLRTTYGMPERPLHLNEYGVQVEQNPSSSAWFMARFERNNAVGMRGNWENHGGIYKNLGALLNSTTGSYLRTGEWPVYEFYKQNLVGTRLTSQTASDGFLDVFATKTSDSIIALAGSHGQSGEYTIQFDNVNSVFGDASTVNANVVAFPDVEVSIGAQQKSNGPVTVTNNTVKITYTITDNTAYGITITK